jgi:hypothetical protein
MAAYEAQWVSLCSACLMVAIYYDANAFGVPPDCLGLSVESKEAIVDQNINAAKNDARKAICDAISDGKIRVRFLVARIEGGADDSVVQTIQGGEELLLAGIRPKHFDWSKSRSSTAFRRKGPREEHWELEAIDVYRPDLDSVLCAEPVAGDTPQQKPVVSARPPKKRTSPALERAKAAIAALYPNGVPDQVALPNVALYRAVGKKLKAEGLAPVSDDTISRAAARRCK